MSADFTIMSHKFDLASGRTDDKRHAFPVGPWTVGSVQLVPGYAISGSYAVTFYRSNDGGTGTADPEEGVQSLTAAGFTETLDMAGYAFLVAVVTTNATSGEIHLYLCVKADQ